MAALAFVVHLLDTVASGTQPLAPELGAALASAVGVSLLVDVVWHPGSGAAVPPA